MVITDRNVESVISLFTSMVDNNEIDFTLLDFITYNVELTKSWAKSAAFAPKLKLEEFYAKLGDPIPDE